ncbi:TPA: DNA-binding protein [Candidatus Falkowbacteria bacterium]|nr:DNA-binding protein [Candidatus Falkowbacteria bacterium]HAY12416.1 DNA-binding protein [Candidatus Falkowbacteria bacterium]HBI96922.1 DNA-binding protein [Candidatus Falkowbacteria bacterium]HBT27581.1 DNA-binding protein [Candidatus Falkowbacteria bacterium]HBY15270.1 DNA-binding protein [Candidatus Falkowbacteria bacterium]
MPLEKIENKILLIRGEKVMLDRDLAGFYGVDTRSLNQAVKRNIERFPDDFMFQLTRMEAEFLEREGIIDNLKSQIVISNAKNIKKSHSSRSQIVILNEKSGENSQSSKSQIVTLNNRGKNIKYLPYVFTEQGVAMLSSVLKSKRAVETNIIIMRAFVNIRKLVYSYKDLADKIMQIEKDSNKKFSLIFKILDLLMAEGMSESLIFT